MRSHRLVQALAGAIGMSMFVLGTVVSASASTGPSTLRVEQRDSAGRRGLGGCWEITDLPTHQRRRLDYAVSALTDPVALHAPVNAINDDGYGLAVSTETASVTR